MLYTTYICRSEKFTCLLGSWRNRFQYKPDNKLLTAARLKRSIPELGFLIYNRMDCAHELVSLDSDLIYLKDFSFFLLIITKINF